MRADNTAPLIAAARNRHELTRAKAICALRELDRAGTPITFETVARQAGVSRSWLYSQLDLRTDIERLREATGRAPTAAVPAAQRTSDASLLRRLQAAQARNRQLSEDNQRLRRQLAHALGDQRAAEHLGQAPQTGRMRHSSATIGPC
jgi:AraC-like DNA-binding protein